ncbi:hypothetical protein U6K99_12330, partial [Cutibacterium acnes]
ENKQKEVDKVMSNTGSWSFIPKRCNRGTPVYHSMGFPGCSVVKIHLPMQEMWVRPLGGEDPLEKEMATHSSILAWKIPWTEEPGRLQSMRSLGVGRY